MKLTREDVDDIKFMFDNGMTQVEIAYVFDVNESTISRVLCKPRRRYKKVKVSVKRLYGGEGLVGSGCSVKVDPDAHKGSIETELPLLSDPTYDEVAMFEILEEMDDEDALDNK